MAAKIRVTDPQSHSEVKVEVSTDGENFTDITSMVRRYRIIHEAGGYPIVEMEFVNPIIIEIGITEEI